MKAKSEIFAGFYDDDNSIDGIENELGLSIELTKYSIMLLPLMIVVIALLMGEFHVALNLLILSWKLLKFHLWIHQKIFCFQPFQPLALQWYN